MLFLEKYTVPEFGKGVVAFAALDEFGFNGMRLKSETVCRLAHNCALKNVDEIISRYEEHTNLITSECDLTEVGYAEMLKKYRTFHSKNVCIHNKVRYPEIQSHTTSREIVCMEDLLIVTGLMDFGDTFNEYLHKNYAGQFTTLSDGSLDIVTNVKMMEMVYTTISETTGVDFLETGCF